MSKIYGYARCSTTEKRQDVERQVTELYSMGAKVVVQEYGSGADAGRKGFVELMEALAPGDSLYATELSRITRDLHHLCHVIEEAANKRLQLRFGGLTFDCTEGEPGPFPKAMLHMMGAFAELERDLAAQRINSGIAQARANGIKLGRPAKTAEQVPCGVRKYYETYREGKITVTEYAEKAEVSRPSIYKYVKLLEAEAEGKAESKAESEDRAEAEEKRKD